MVALDEVNGVGGKAHLLLNKLGIFTVDDLINYYPRRYEVIKKTDLKSAGGNDRVVIDGVVEKQPVIVGISSKLKKIFFRVYSDNQMCNIVVYNKVYLCNELKSGMNIIIIGKYDKFRNSIMATDVRLGKLGNKISIESIYYVTAGLRMKSLSRYINNILGTDFECLDYIPKCFVNKYNFMEKRTAIREIHNPSSILSLKKARQRIKYEELFCYLLKLNYMKYLNSKDNEVFEKKFDDNDVDKFIDNLRFKLTSDQLATINIIGLDLRSKKRMNRLIQGDVGSGKTIIAMVAAYMNYLAGYQTALMVPTEILACQHYSEANFLFSYFGVKCCLLTSSIPKKQKKKLYDDIRIGAVDLIIGTQSLIQEDLEYCNLGLIITDEQHRFGVKQREKLKNKGVFPDVLSMSATPIPRTYALTIYGDMDVSSIKTKPVGRKKVITYYKREKEIVEVLQMMKREIDFGHQIYVIAPNIDNEERDGIDNVVNLCEKMRLAFGKICNVGMIFGKMKNEEKNQIMKDFEEKKISILVSTTVIEVGVNVSNASMIVIFNANFFGLSTLHQLRGRVGRGDIQSYCVLLSNVDCERLKKLEICDDGFELSEFDFLNRGEGEVFGIRQSGENIFRIASIKNDYEMLVKVKKDVEEFMDNLFYDTRHNEILDYLEKMVDVG